MWNVNGHITTLFSCKGLEIIHQERRRHMKTIVMQDFNSIFFQKFGAAKKQLTTIYNTRKKSQLLKKVV